MWPVQELKAKVSKYLRFVRASWKLEQLQRQGLIRWNGGKPRGGRLRPKITGKSLGDSVLEDRE